MTRGLLAAAAVLVAMAAPPGALAQLPPLPPILPPPGDGGGGAGGGGVGEDGSRSVTRVATTGSKAELIERLDIKRTAGGGRVILSLGPRRLPRLRRGTRLQALAEMQVSTTCADPSPRCVGKRYRFSPLVTAKAVLAGSRDGRGGRGSIRLTPRPQVRCGQRRPNRNHHCTLTLVGKPQLLRRRPRCAPSCHLNLIVSARHRKSRSGHVVAVAADRPNGSIEQRHARLSLIARSGPGSGATKRRTRERLVNRLPIEEEARRGSRVIHSVAVPRLRKGEKLRAVAVHSVGIDHLPYPAYIGSRIILARGPRSTTRSGSARLTGAGDGTFGPRNGFNCTQGPSGYRTPCTARKAGVLSITKSAGRRRPLYVNLIARAKPLLAIAGESDKARVRRGHLTVTRFPRN